MKTNFLKHLSFLTLLLALQSCGTVNYAYNNWKDYSNQNSKTKEAKKAKIAKSNQYAKMLTKLSNFDREKMENDPEVISHMIKIVQPELDNDTRNRYANDIHLAIKKFKNVEPHIMVAIIDVESDFQYTKVSETGDLSIAQINPRIWDKEFQMMRKNTLDIKKLTAPEQTYAMEKMAKILSIIKKRHEKKDRRWYARYHSNTPKLKTAYLLKLDERMRLLARNQYLSKKNSLALAQRNEKQKAN